MEEAFNPFKGLDGDMPADFKPETNVELPNFTHKSWRFTGKDGKERRLVFKAGDEGNKYGHDDQHGVIFNVYAGHEKDFSAMQSHLIEKHGRGEDVMNAVAHAMKSHVARTEPDGINWLADKKRHRMYQAVIKKMRLNSFRMLPMQKNDPIAIMTRNKAELKESFLGPSSIEPRLPTDFEPRPEHTYESQHGSQTVYRFKGKDGDTRHLLVNILHHNGPHASHHHVNFGVLGEDPTNNDPGDEDPDEVQNRVGNGHGRGQDVMSAVMHVVKQHVMKHDPENISFHATSTSRQRLYKSIFQRMGGSGRWIQTDDSNGGIIRKWPKF